MYWTDISEKVRINLINDQFIPYRFSEEKLVSYASSGIKKIRNIRPSARLNSEIQLLENKEISYGGLFDYTDTGSQFADYYKITGWDREQYPSLYFNTVSTSQIDIYGSESDKNLGTNKLAHVLQVDTIGDKTITADNNSGFAGRVTNNVKAETNTVWSVTAEEQPIPLDDNFEENLIYFIASKCYQLDNSDTVNLQKSTYFINEFNRLLGI